MLSLGDRQYSERAAQLASCLALKKTHQATWESRDSPVNHDEPTRAGLSESTLAMLKAAETRVSISTSALASS